MTIPTTSYEYNVIWNGSTPGIRLRTLKGIASAARIIKVDRIGSGFIILQVLSDKGEYIVTLDVRKKSAMDYASNSTISSSYLSCLDPPKQEEEEEANSAGRTFSGRRGKERVLLLDRNYVRWHKLLGLYMADFLFG